MITIAMFLSLIAFLILFIVYRLLESRFGWFDRRKPEFKTRVDSFDESMTKKSD